MNFSFRILFLLALVALIDALAISERKGERSQVVMVIFDVLTNILRGTRRRL